LSAEPRSWEDLNGDKKSLEGGRIMIDKRNREIVPVLKLVRSFASRWMPNKDERDDIVQTVMLKLLSAKVDIGTVSKGYLYATTRNTAIDVFRSGWHLVDKVVFVDQIDLDTVDAVLAPPIAPPASDPFLKQQVREVYEGLSKEHRQVIALKVENYSDQEIADRLGLPIGTVKSRFYNARRYFKERLVCA
jgi:RNA polymerase sigma factor (sigma-70 family)